MAANRIDSIRNKHLKSDKTYPIYLEQTIVTNTAVPINPIQYNSLEHELTRLNLKNKRNIKTTPCCIYKHKTDNKYYIRYNYSYSNLRPYIFDVTNDYDWEQIIKTNEIDFIDTHDHHYIVQVTSETKHYLPGSPQFDSQFPKVSSI